MTATVDNDQVEVHETLPGGWEATYTVRRRSGAVEVVSVTVAAVGAVPPGGFTSRDARRLRPARAATRAAEALPIHTPDPFWPVFAREYRTSAAHTDLWYASLAALYASVASTSPRDAVDLVASYLRAHGAPYHRSTVRDMVSETRHRGFLSAPVPGRAGGAVTEAAVEVLDDEAVGE